MSTAAATRIPQGVWSVDPVHSSVGFEVKHSLVSKFRGSFHDYDVTLDTVDGKPRLVGNVRVASVETRNDDLSAHLLSPEFFDAEGHPEISFSSDELDVDDEGRVTLRGELSIRGVSKPVEVTGEYTYVEQGLAGTPVIGLDLETVVDRREYGIEWNAPLPSGGLVLANNVKLSVLVELGPSTDKE